MAMISEPSTIQTILVLARELSADDRRWLATVLSWEFDTQPTFPTTLRLYRRSQLFFTSQSTAFNGHSPTRSRPPSIPSHPTCSTVVHPIRPSAVVPSMCILLYLLHSVDFTYNEYISAIMAGADFPILTFLDRDQINSLREYYNETCMAYGLSKGYDVLSP
jgi:hypothetical protein